ncbi:hypothetical protein D3C76_1732100 [compost metagenome]
MDGGQRAGIGPDPGETGMAQADLARIAGQDDDAGDGQRVDEDQRADPEIIARGKEERRGGDQRRHDQQGQVFLRNPHVTPDPSICGRKGPAA